MSTDIVSNVTTADWQAVVDEAAGELADRVDLESLDHPQAAVMALLRNCGWTGPAAENVAGVMLGGITSQGLIAANRHIDQMTDPEKLIVQTAGEVGDARAAARSALKALRRTLEDHRDEATGLPTGDGTRFDFDAPAPTTPWLVPGLLVRGSVHLLSGREHAFKTGLWDAAMIASLTNGRLLDVDVDPLRWLRLDMENPPRKIRERWGAMGFTNDMWDAVRLHERGTRVRLTEQLWQDWLRRQIEGHEPDVIVLDTVTRIWFGMDANANDQIVRVFDYLQPICDEYDVAVVLVHHQRKSGGKGDDAALGGVQWQGQADQTATIAATSTLSFDHQADGTANTLRKFAVARPKGRDLVDPAPLHFEVAGVVSEGRLTSMSVQLPTIEPTTVERLVAALSKPLGTGALAEAVDLNRTGDKFRKALAEATDSGQIVKNDDGQLERGESA